MKKIAFFIPSIQRCGPVNVVASLMKELYQQYEIYLIVIRSEDMDYDFSSELSQYLSSPPIFLSSNRNLRISKLTNELEKYLLELNISVVHAHGFIPMCVVLFANLKQSTKKIVTLHNIPYKDYLSEYGLFKGSVLAISQYTLLNVAPIDAIVSCSKSVQKGFLGHSFGINRKKLHVIYNGVDTNIFFPLSKELRSEARKAQNITENTKVFVYCGRLCRRKRVIELISLFKKMNHKYDARLYIVGEGEELDECLKMADNNPNIIFTGFVSNPVLFYQIADFVISNSAAEGYPLGILEGMACGAKALLSDIDPHREIIDNFPTRAFLLDEKNIEKISLEKSKYDEKLSSHYMAQNYRVLYQ